MDRYSLILNPTKELTTFCEWQKIPKFKLKDLNEHSIEKLAKTVIQNWISKISRFELQAKGTPKTQMVDCQQIAATASQICSCKKSKKTDQKRKLLFSVTAQMLNYDQESI